MLAASPRQVRQPSSAMTASGFFNDIGAKEWERSGRFEGMARGSFHER
jgi:hypothetical protein